MITNNKVHITANGQIIINIDTNERVWCITIIHFVKIVEIAKSFLIYTYGFEQLNHVIGWTAHTYGIWVHGNNAINSVQKHYLCADNFITYTTI